MSTEKKIKTTKNKKTGTVVKSAAAKTITVSVDTLVLHPIVKKYIKKRSKFLVHDAKSEAKSGDIVEIVESRPISKNKRWKLSKVIKSKEIISLN